MKGYLTLSLVFLLHLQFLYGQLNIQIKQVDETGNINTSTFPFLSADIKVIYNGKQVELKKDDIKILESGSVYTAKADKLSPIVNGWQTLTWVPEQSTFSSTYQCIIYALYNNELINGFAMGRLNKYPFTIITDQDNLQIRDAFWGEVQPGNNIPYQVRFRTQINSSAGDGPFSLRLDSITTRTKYFQVKWLGSDSDFDRSPPPRNLEVGSSYWINVYFKPDEYIPYQDVLTFHYEGGLKRNVPLYGNDFTVDAKSLIQLVAPNGGEKLAPCETFQIKWKGHAPQYPVEIYYSANGGYSWNFIAEVQDSVYNWTVPDIEANNLLVKVRQNFKQNNMYNLGKDMRNTLDAGFNQFSTQVSFLNQIGNLLTYDISNLPPTLKSFNYLNDEYEEGDYTSYGVVYSPYDSLYYVAYTNNNVSYGLQKDTIAIIDPNNKYPINKITLNEKFRIKEIKADITNSMIVAIPRFGNQVYIYNSKDFSLLKTFTFNTQVMDFSFNSALNQAAALLLDGEIRLIDMTTNTIIKELNYNEFSNFVQISLSPNGKLLSVGTKYDNSGLKNNIYVIEIATGKIVRVFTPSQGDPIGLFFNPSSSTLVTGSASEKQIAFYDLTTSKNTGQLYGHSTRMNDIALAPNGLSLITTASGQDNVSYRTFVYPEEDKSDSSLSIRRPILNLDNIVYNPVYLGTSNDYNINDVCNLSEVVATFPDAKFKSGLYFRLNKAWELTTIQPSQCLNFDINITPLDTGIIRDTLAIRSCNSDYLLPFEIRVLPRNISYLSHNYDFGDVCIGDTSVATLELIRNDDPVPLMVNYIKFNSPHDRNFSIQLSTIDTIIPPGGTLSGIVKFFPDTLGNYLVDATLHHSNQNKIVGKFGLKGKGIGSYIKFSHKKLLFIPEVLIREFTITNIGTTDINFTDFVVNPPENFEFLSDKNFILKSNESKTLQIRWNGIKQKADLLIEATPCLSQNKLPLDMFEGVAELKIAKVSTSAKNEHVEIPIEVTPFDREPYQGIRPFEATLEVNPKLFIPTGVVSDMGQATLISNIVNGKREFKIRVDGNFDTTGTLAVIKGVAGLSDTNYSDITIKEPSAKFGEFVNTVIKNGSIFINDICNDRYIQNNHSPITIKGLSPNPANEHITLSFDSKSSEAVRIEMINSAGAPIFKIKHYKTKSGTNYITFDTSKFSVGNYSVNISCENSVQSISFIIMR
ncbi:MAG TPA: hypothetical protein PLE30_07365 [Candidatus Kapabacteria bacterium]|nr:hypothetical protein [Candidatus Kapabacteria bacterium]